MLSRFLKPLTTTHLEPQDQGLYATIKARFINYRILFVVKNDQIPNQFQVNQKVANLTLDVTKELVTAT